MISINFLLDNPFSKIQELQIKKWLQESIHREGKKPGDITYVICDDEYLLHINLDFLQHDFYTDIITFSNANHPEIISGEIYVSLSRVIENAIMHQVDLFDEFCRVCIHGILHLVGYDDHAHDDIIEMRGKEDYYLNLRP
ncbi:MAG: rRNA maturation RNase YbeY [Bacteroidales bacterium]|nr:rRNA maturation RNase YbeY [Bacteroidales bacterium]